MEFKTLGTLVDRKIGYGIVQPGQSVKNGVPVIKVNNIISGLYDINDLDTTTHENDAQYSRTRLNGGEVILSVVGTIGKTAIVPNQFAGCNLVRATALIDIKTPWLAQWVKYYIDSKQGQIYITQNLNTTVQPTLNIKSLVEMPIPFYDESYMMKATGILSELDSKIELNKKINNNLEQQASTLITEYLECTDNEVKFSDIMRFENGFAFSSKSYLTSGKYRIITIKNVQDGQIDSSNAACLDILPLKMKEECKLQVGDVLLSLTGNVGRVGIVCENNLLLNQRVAKFIPYDKALLPFLYFVFRQQNTKTKLELISRGTAQANLSPIETLDLCINFEKDSATMLSNNLKSLFQQIIHNNQENMNLIEIRDALLPQLISGELDVSNIEI